MHRFGGYAKKPNISSDLSLAISPNEGDIISAGEAGIEKFMSPSGGVHSFELRSLTYYGNKIASYPYIDKFTHIGGDTTTFLTACLVRDGKILVAKPSSDDSQYHAEYLVLQELEQKGIAIEDKDVLYTTLEPCSDLPNVNNGKDCTTCLLDAGVRHIIYAAKDPEYSTKATERLQGAGVTYQQVQNQELIQQAQDLFNSTITIDLSKMKLPRQEKI